MNHIRYRCWFRALPSVTFDHKPGLPEPSIVNHTTRAEAIEYLGTYVVLEPLGIETICVATDPPVAILFEPVGEKS